MEARAVRVEGAGRIEPEHVPVLCADVVRLLATGRRGVLVDGTVGLGGHAEALLTADPALDLIGVDRDPEALRIASARLARFGTRVRLVHGSFANLAIHLAQLGVDAVDGVLLDLGVSSLQLDAAERGFSLRFEGPLDMRMDPTSGITGAEWLARIDVAELERALADYGEERYSRRIARAVVEAREREPIETTAQLVRIVHRAVPGSYFAQKIDPATRTFQAIRIALNGELAALDRGLVEAFDALRGGGVLAVISFHSLEDRRVKTFLRERAAACTCPPDLPECRCGKRVEAEILTRRPIVASPEEVAANPRARSAKLRAARRVT